MSDEMSRRSPPPAGGSKVEPKAVWGPKHWYWLHTYAIKYPANPTAHERLTAHADFWAFIQKLPCPECRMHANSYASEYPPDFTDSDTLQTWAWRFHNAVNARLKKPLMTGEQYRETYANELSQRYWPYAP